MDVVQIHELANFIWEAVCISQCGKHISCIRLCSYNDQLRPGQHAGVIGVPGLGDRPRYDILVLYILAGEDMTFSRSIGTLRGLYGSRTQIALVAPQEPTRWAPAVKASIDVSQNLNCPWGRGLQLLMGSRDAPSTNSARISKLIRVPKPEAGRYCTV